MAHCCGIRSCERQCDEDRLPHAALRAAHAKDIAADQSHRTPSASGPSREFVRCPSRLLCGSSTARSAPSFASFLGGIQSPTVNTSLCESCSRRLVRARLIEGHRQRTSVSNDELDPCCSSRERPPQAGRGDQVGLSSFRQQRRHGAARRHDRLKVIVRRPARQRRTRFRAHLGGFSRVPPVASATTLPPPGTFNLG